MECIFVVSPKVIQRGSVFSVLENSTLNEVVLVEAIPFTGLAQIPPKGSFAGVVRCIPSSRPSNKIFSAESSSTMISLHKVLVVETLE